MRARSAGEVSQTRRRGKAARHEARAGHVERAMAPTGARRTRSARREQSHARGGRAFAGVARGCRGHATCASAGRARSPQGARFVDSEGRVAAAVAVLERAR